MRCLDLLDICSSLNYNQITFEWDENKSFECEKLRGFSFEAIIKSFQDDDKVITKDQRHEYGENRYEMLAMLRERLFVIIFTTRNAAIRIISARKANEREKKKYQNQKYYS